MRMRGRGRGVRESGEGWERTVSVSHTLQPVVCWDGTRHRAALPDTARHGIPIGRSSIERLCCSVCCVVCCVCVCVCVCVRGRKKIGRALDQRCLRGLAGVGANAGSPREVVDGGPPAVEVQEAEADEEGLHSTLHRQPVTAGVDKAVLHDLIVRLHWLRSPTDFAVTVPPHRCQRPECQTESNANQCGGQEL